jgi:hypothetical protein
VHSAGVPENEISRLSGNLWGEGRVSGPRKRNGEERKRTGNKGERKRRKGKRRTFFHSQPFSKNHSSSSGSKPAQSSGPHERVSVRPVSVKC